MIDLGVSGHRFLTEVDLICHGLDIALGSLSHAFDSSSFRLFTLLAEGADQLVARQVLRWSGSELIVPLPLPLEEYLAGFQSKQSRSDFYTLYDKAVEIIRLPTADSQELAFQQAGSYILEHCSVLMVIWDGQSAQGPGGTGELAAAARTQEKPLVWIKAGNRLPGTDRPTSLGEEQGQVVFENLPDPE